MKPKLISYQQQKLKDRTVDIACWQNPKNWTQEEVNICIKYYQLMAKKLGMNISRYMSEFE
jgi:hypothetical protein